MSHRAAIFALRAQTDPATGKLYSFGKIADTLGVSKSLVAKELHRTSNDPGADGAGADDGLGLAPTGAGADPDLQLAQRELAQERLALQRMRLRADRLTEERRLQLLENPGQGGGNGMMLLLDQQLRQLREEIGRLSQRQAVQAAGAGSLVDQLSQFRQVTETMQAFAPSRPPSSAVELELEAMRQRLQMEDRERMRRLDIDERERMERAAGERARGEAIARLIESSGPLLAQAVQRWAGDTPPAAGVGAGAVAPGERPMVLPNPAGGTILAPGVVMGACPSCGAALRLRSEPGQLDRCPRCQQLLAVVNGAIQPKLPPEGGLNYAS